ncbi:MAG: outer membrane beta-barrel protein [Cellvibrionaceae bacterium]
MKKNKLFPTSLLLLCFSCLIIGNAYAQDSEGAFVLGPFDVAPSVGIQVLKDDNIFQEEENTTDDTITTVTPAVSLLFDNGVSGFSLTYQVDAGYYSEETSEDYTDQRVSTTFGWAVGDRSRLQFDASLFDSQDERSVDNASQGNLIDQTTDLDEYEDLSYSVTYTIGDADSILGFSVNAGVFEKEYSNNEIFTQFNNFESTSYGGQVIWRVTPDISLTTGLSQRETDYDIDTENRTNAIDPSNVANSDSDQTIYDIGLNWDGGQVTGGISFGQSEREFDDGTQDTDSDRWNVSLGWAPFSYSVFSLSATRSQDESSSQQGSLQGTFIDREDLTLSWTHDWTDRFSTSVSVSDSNSDFVNDAREDDTTTYSFDVAYSFNRWLGIGLFVSELERDSTDDAIFDYDRTQYGLSLSVTP